MCERNCSTWLLNIFTSVYAAGASNMHETLLIIF